MNLLVPSSKLTTISLINQSTIIVSTNNNMINLFLPQSASILQISPLLHLLHLLSLPSLIPSTSLPYTPPCSRNPLHSAEQRRQEQTFNNPTHHSTALSLLKSPLLRIFPRFLCTNISSGSTPSVSVSTIKLSLHPTQRMCGLGVPVLGMKP